MYHPSVRGSYYEMGRHYGEILYKQGFKLPPRDAQATEFAERSEGEIRRVFPRVLDEFQGFADGCHVGYEALVTFVLTVGVKSNSFKCSVFGASSNGGVIFGRNYDFYYEYKRYAGSFLTVPDEGFASVGNSDIFIGREDGVNENGLAVGMAFVGSRVVKPGINFPLAVRLVLDCCSNVEEAVRELTRVHFSTTNNYLLTDHSGDLAVVEASPERCRVRRTEKCGFLVCTNHFVHPEMSKMEDLTQRSSDSVQRYDTISSEIERRNKVVTLPDARKILSSHEGAVCAHREDIKLGTLWSVIADLSKMRILLAEGHPCKVDYKQDARLYELVGNRN